MAGHRLCQRPDCGKPGKLRTMADPTKGKKVKLHLCDEDYDEARANREPPLWFRELLTHIGLVG